MPRLGRISLLGLFLLSVGCSGGRSSMPPQDRVQGTVYFRGHALPGGMIVFVPDSERGNRGELLTASIQSNGQFSILPAPGQPIPLGWHRVAIAPPSRSSSSESRVTLSLFENVPDRYRSPSLSLLSCELKPGLNSMNIHLEDY